VKSEVFKSLLTIKPEIRLRYEPRWEKGLLLVTVDCQNSGYKVLREIPQELLTVPEQLLVKILIHQPQRDGAYDIQKDYQERVLFFLQDIVPGFTATFDQGPLRLTYVCECAPTYCKVVPNVKASGFVALRDVPRDQLSAEERIFISFLAGIPINGGSFFVSQHLLAKLFYLLAKLKNVVDLQGKPILVSSKNFHGTLVVDNMLRLTCRDDDGRCDEYTVVGERNYFIKTRGIYAPINAFAAQVLNILRLEKDTRITAGDFPDFISMYVPLIREHMDVELHAEAENLNKRIITRVPTPVLKLQKEGKEVLVAVLYDYGLPEQAVYDPAFLDDYYTVTIGTDEYFLRRDKKSEDWFHQFLLDHRFQSVATGYLIAEDDFIDFFTYEYAGLRANIGLKIMGDALEQYHFEAEGEFSVDVDFRESSGIDWFEFAPTYKVKEATFTHQQIKELVEEKKEYIRLPDGSLVKVPIKEFEYLQSYLEGRKSDAKTGKFKVKKHDIYYLYSAVRMTLKAKVDDSLQSLLRGLDNFEGLPVVPSPTSITGMPRHYQEQGFHWLAFLQAHSFHGVLADDMGLGKTLQVLMLLQYLKETGQKKGPSLIIAPTSVVYNWVNEVQKFTPSLKVLVLSGSKQRLLKVKEVKNYDIVITSYALLRNDLDHYANVQFYYCILDEAQAIKNHKAQVTQAVKCLTSQFRLALTGTPIENRLSELWSLLDFLMPGFLGSSNFFRTVYDSDHERLRRKIKPFILRRTKKEVLKDLPPKNEIDSFNELLTEQEDLYVSILQSQKKELLTVIDKQGISRAQLNILASLLKLRQVCCHPALLKGEPSIAGSAKFEQFKELLEEIVEDGHKVIVFSQFVQMLTIMRKYLETQKITYSYLDGSTRDRQAEIDRFNNTPEIQVFLCSLKAGGLGINLTAANYVILYDPWWNPAVEQQAMDRVYRIGQKKEVFVYKLISKGTVEEKILKLQQKKKSLIDAVVISEGASVKTITKEDLEELFSY
jgi:non-specific serine/threonine protein kinase